ncbi:MAG: thymidine phosphorylase [Calditrichaeota bacterium]|nr:thymidine phosphorylase [Calditrichota bacterium]
MTPYEIIARKRDGQELSAEEIHYFVTSYLKGAVKDYQMSAFLMAVFLRGMTDREISALTRSYIESGKVIDLSDIPGKKVDKHSTGGVGDKVSILLAPLVASCGVPVPMISGRGLGHTGGTLDKLESIPGFQTRLSVDTFRQLLKKHGVAMIGQTEDIVPADKRIYALRDVTATVESIPLITASIMSKKIAEGIDGLVLDVKVGNGAFMQEMEQARALAGSLIRVGREFGKNVVVCLTNMDQPLGKKVGNWLEVEECLDGFHGKAPQDLMELTYRLAAHMLVLGGKAADLETAEEMCKAAIASGKAFQKFLEMARAQGADVSVLEKPETYPVARFRATLEARESGYVFRMQTREMGLAAVELGAGRLRAEDPVDAQAGIILFKKVGDSVEKGEPLLEIRTNKEAVIEQVFRRLKNAIVISGQIPKPQPLVLEEILS